MVPISEVRAIGSGLSLRGGTMKQPNEPEPPATEVDPEPPAEDPNEDAADEEPTEEENTEDAGEEGTYDETEDTVDENDIETDTGEDTGMDMEGPTEDEYDSDDGNDALQVDANEAYFIKDIIKLYTSIRNTIQRLDSLSFDDVITNKVIIQVKKNLSTLLGYVYDYILFKYDKNTYGQNLFIYRYLILSYKENVNILSSIKTFAARNL